MGGIMHHLQDHHIKFKGDVAFSVCVISLVEGLIRQLDAEFDMFAAAMPYFHKYHMIDSIQIVEKRVEATKRRKKAAAAAAAAAPPAAKSTPTRTTTPTATSASSSSSAVGLATSPCGCDPAIL